jgi:hypothetical protein
MRFRFRLARDLGMTVGELERTMTSVEFLWWTQIYAQEAEERKAEARG